MPRYLIRQVPRCFPWPTVFPWAFYIQFVKLRQKRNARVDRNCMWILGELTSVGYWGLQSTSTAYLSIYLDLCQCFKWIFITFALTGMAQWVGCHLTNWKVASLIPGLGACLGFRPGPPLGACKRQLVSVSLAHQCFSPYWLFIYLFPFLPSFLFLPSSPSI